MKKLLNLIVNGKYFIFLIVGYQQVTYWLKIPAYNSISAIAYKDAANWELCSQSVAMYGIFPTNISDWCLRRPINIELLALFLRIAQSMAGIYFLLGFIFAITIFWSYTHFRKILSPRESIFMLILIFSVWITFCNNMVLSESIALILGTLCLGIAAKIYLQFKLIDVLSLSILLTLIQIIRPGNLISPFLLILLVPLITSNFNSKILLASALLLVPFLYPVSIKLFTKIFYYDNYLTGGNAWSSIYGLINKNISWQEAYSRVPKNIGDSEILANQYLMDQSVSNFIDRPFDIFVSVWDNLFFMLSNSFPFISPVTITIPEAIVPFAFLASSSTIAYILRRLYKKSINTHLKLFIFFFLFSTIIFYSVSWKSEPARSLSPTLPLFIFMILYSITRKNSPSTNNQKDFVMQPKSYIALLIIPIIVVYATIATNRISARFPVITNSISNCPEEYFSFQKETLSIAYSSTIKKVSVFSWADLIDKLPRGYIVQGIAIIENEPIALTGYFQSDNNYGLINLHDACFRIKSNSLVSQTMQDLNFISLELST